MSEYRFKLGMYLAELQLPFDEALPKAKELGIKYLWVDRVWGGSPVARMSDEEVERLAESLAAHGLEVFVLSGGSSFKQVHLTELKLDAPDDHEGFRGDFAAIVRTMQIARRLGVRGITVHAFAWPGEYGDGGKATWPMRWLTQGGVIADVDMEKLTRIYTMLLEEAERYDVDLVVSMLPWQYTNTTNNFRSLAERLGSRRIKAAWGPADGTNCGEVDVATTGFNNVRPYLHALHLKDLRVIDGLHLKFEYCPIGEGDVDYPTILRNLRDHACDVVLSLSTHFRPPGGSAEDAMRINCDNLRRLISQVEAEEG
jgi:sugar phosphate isomerase/epimerase